MPRKRVDTGTRTPAWMDKVSEFQTFSVPRTEIRQSVHSADKRVAMGVDNPTYQVSSFDEDFRLQTPVDQLGTSLTEFTEPYSRPSSDSIQCDGYQYICVDDTGDYPLGPKAGKKGKYVRPLYIHDYSDDGSEPKSRRKRIIILVVIGIFIVVAAAAVALTVTLLKKEANLNNVVVDLTMPLNQEYISAYANLSSVESRNFSDNFCKNLTSVMTQYDGGFKGCTVTDLKNGSVIVTFKIFFVTITAKPTTKRMQDFFTKQHQENRGDTEFLALIKIDQIDVKDVSTDVKEEEFKPNYTVPDQTTTTTKATSTVPADTSTTGTTTGTSDTGNTTGTSDTGTTTGASDTGNTTGTTSDTGTTTGTSDTGTTTGTASDTGTTAQTTSSTSIAK